jgi:hypothetical protein
MAMMGQDYKVWHDACHDGIRSSASSNRSHGFGMTGADNWQIYQGELAKIKQVIDSLPVTPHCVGMALFAPEVAIPRKCLTKTRTLLWGVFMSGWPNRMKSPDQCARAYTLLKISVDEARHSYHRADTAERYDCSSKYSHRELAEMLEVNHQNVDRDWQPVIAAMSVVLIDYADKALTPVREEIQRINSNYR